MITVAGWLGEKADFKKGSRSSITGALIIRYSTIEIKEAARIEYSGFHFPYDYSGEG